MRRACLLLGAVLMFLAHPAFAGTLIEPTKVLGGPGVQFGGSRSLGLLAYSEVTGSTGPHGFIRNLATDRDKRINAAGTRAWTGGFNPGTDEVIFQQAKGPVSDIFLYDYSERDRYRAPDKVNTRLWEWDPRISNSYISFFRNIKIGGRPYWGIYLYRSATDRAVRIEEYPMDSVGLVNGFVGEEYATWTACGGICNAWVYEIATKELRRIPDPRNRHRYGPVVDEANGVVFFVRSGLGCGNNVDFWSVPAATLGATPTRVASLPDGFDTGAQVSIQPNETEPTRDLIYEQGNCSGTVDLYALESVSAAP